MDDVFISRAKQLRSAKEYLQEEPTMASATALLAVHSGIALNDALLAVWLGQPLKSEDHRTAADKTEKECRNRGLNQSGIRHLRALIKSKSSISYGDRPVSHARALSLAESANRFEAWIYTICKELAQWDQLSPVPDV